MASLLALSRAGAEEAKKLIKRRYIAQIFTLLIGLAGAYIYRPEALVYVLIVCAFLSELVVWYLGYRAREVQDDSETAHRRAMLINGLGTTQELIDVADIRHRLSYLEKQAESLDDEKYYASKLPTGPQRLKEHLQESTFWSKYLYRYASNRSFIIVGLIFAGVMFVALTTLPNVANNISLFIGKGLIILLGFVISVDELGRALAWKSASEKAEAVDRRLDKADVGSLELVLAIFSDYSVAIASAPPIPTSLYKSKKKHLTKLWQQRTGR